MKKTINEWLGIQNAVDGVLVGVQTADGKSRVAAIDNDLEMIASFRLAEVSDKIGKELETFGKKRNELFEKYGEKVEEQSDALRISEEKLPEFEKEILPLLEVEKKIDIDPIPASLFKGVKWTRSGAHLSRTLFTIMDLEK